MILYYALGGGLGHLTRARAVLHTLFGRDEAMIVTSGRNPVDRRVVGDVPVVDVPPDLSTDRVKFQQWTRDLIADIQPGLVILDTFPGGICAEWCGLKLPEGTRVYFVARLLRWDRYAPLLSGSLPPIEKVYSVEPLRDPYLKWLKALTAEVVSLELKDPPLIDEGRELMERINGAWLIVHSGGGDEIRQLVEYARETQIQEGVNAPLVLVSPSRPPADLADVDWLDVYPAYPLFPAAGRIVSGCGHNVFRQTESCVRKHRFLPFPRRFDDQFQRAARRRRSLNP